MNPSLKEVFYDSRWRGLHKCVEDEFWKTSLPRSIFYATAIEILLLLLSVQTRLNIHISLINWLKADISGNYCIIWVLFLLLQNAIPLQCKSNRRFKNKFKLTVKESKSLILLLSINSYSVVLIFGQSKIFCL
mgnify:CR=1 FL=1